MNIITLGSMMMAIWLLLWGELSPANVASGLLMVTVILWLIPDSHFEFRRPRVRPVALARFGLYLLVDVIRANWLVIKAIVSRTPPRTTGVVEVPLRHSSDGLLTLVANLLALTPGTMPLEATQNPPVIYVHILQLRDVEEARRDVQHLSELAIRALGSPEAIAALDEAEVRLPDSPPAAPDPEDEP